MLIIFLVDAFTSLLLIALSKATFTGVGIAITLSVL
jgi:hypothetical protein